MGAPPTPRRQPTKDPEALSDTKSPTTGASPPPDPTTAATALITALALLSSQSSSPRVVAFQLSAAVISFTLIALYTWHSRTLVTMEHPQHLTATQQLVKYFPLLVFASTWVLFLLSATFMSPKIMAVTVFLAVFTCIPMVFGAQLPAIFTLVIITLFGLLFIVLVFLVCLVPTEWLK